MEFLRFLWAPSHSRLQYNGRGSRASTGSPEAFTLISLANPLSLSTWRRLASDPVVLELLLKSTNEFPKLIRLGRTIVQTPLYSIIEAAGASTKDLDAQLETMKEDPLLKPYINVVQGRTNLVLLAMMIAELDELCDDTRDNLQGNVYSPQDIGNLIEELSRNPVINSYHRLFNSFDDHSKIFDVLVKALEVVGLPGDVVITNDDHSKKFVLTLKALEVAGLSGGDVVTNDIDHSTEREFYNWFFPKLADALLTPVIQEEMKNLIYNYSKCSLHEAAGTGDIEMLQKLLEDGAKGNQDWEGKTALHYACVFGFEKCTEALLKAGYDVLAMDMDGNTALHYAAAHGRHGCVELLLKSRAILSLENKNGETPIDIAKSRKQYDVLTLLEEAAFKTSCNVWPLELENEGLLTERSFWNYILSFKRCFEKVV